MGYRFTSFWFVNIAFGIAFPLYLQVPSVLHVPWNRNLSLKTISIFVSFIILFIFCLKIVPHPLAVFFFFFYSHLFGPLRAVRIPISLSLTTTLPHRSAIIRKNLRWNPLGKLKLLNFLMDYVISTYTANCLSKLVHQ